jgi:hypothetical protein
MVVRQMMSHGDDGEYTLSFNDNRERLLTDNNG